MAFGRRKKKREPKPGEYPESFTAGFMRQTLPTATPAEARRAVDHLRKEGWSEQKLSERILPFMPRPPRPLEAGTVSLPPKVSRAWLDQNLPAMHHEDIRRVVEQLEQRGWPTVELSMVVLPHLLPKLPRADADAIVSGLRELGMTDAQVAEVSRVR